MLTLLREEWRYLLLATGLLTRLPVPHRSKAPAPGRSLHWYPLVGLLLGLSLLAMSTLPAPALLSAVLITVAWVVLTGGLHLDGLADCADAWVGGLGDRERTLRIMKDPACGPMGVLALAAVLLLKVSALAALSAGDAPWWLIPVFSRALLATAMITTPYVRPGGMGDGLAATARAPAVIAGLGITALAAVVLSPGGLGWLWLLTGCAVLALWRRAMVGRLGGYTGDGAGALVELLEVALLVTTAVAMYGTAR